MKIYLSLILSLLVVCSLQSPYDAGLAHELQRASTASYCPSDKLQDMKCGDSCSALSGYTFYHQFTSILCPFESVSYSIFINTAKHKITFAFRGSADLLQIGHELLQSAPLKYDLHNIPNARATQYFYIKYKNNLRADFLSNLRDLVQRYPDYTFYFTGHSLGGAFACLGALDVSLLHILDKDRIHIYTYGSPREGNYELTQAVNANVGELYRVVHSRDPVPHLPLCACDGKGGCSKTSNPLNFLVWNAYHSGTEVFYDSADPIQYRICPKDEDPTCSNKYGLLDLNPADHSIYLGMRFSCP